MSNLFLLYYERKIFPVSPNSFSDTGDNANSVDPDETAHKEPSHLDLRCLTFSLSTLHINHFPTESLFKKKQSRRQMYSEIWRR